LEAIFKKKENTKKKNKFICGSITAVSCCSLFSQQPPAIGLLRIFGYVPKDKPFWGHPNTKELLEGRMGTRAIMVFPQVSPYRNSKQVFIGSTAI